MTGVEFLWELLEKTGILSKAEWSVEFSDKSNLKSVYLNVDIPSVDNIISHVPFVLDTGCTDTCISVHTLLDLGYEEVVREAYSRDVFHDIKLADGNTAYGAAVMLPTPFKIGNLKITTPNVGIPIIPNINYELTVENRKLKKDDPRLVSANLLGMDILANFDLLISNRHKRIFGFLVKDSAMHIMSEFDMASFNGRKVTHNAKSMSLF